MLRLALTNLRANWTRFAATATAVIVGVAFLCAGLMITDALRTSLLGAVEQRYSAVDLAVTSTSNFAELTGDVENSATSAVLTPPVLAAIRSTGGVAAAAPERTADVRVLRASGDAVSLRTRGQVWINDPSLNPLTLTDGRLPLRPNEVVVDRGTAADAGVSVGGRVRLQTPVGARTATVVGVSRFGNADAVDPGGTVSFPESATNVLTGGAPSWSRVLIRTTGPATIVAAALSDQLPARAQVVTGAQLISDEQLGMSVFVDVLRPILWGFAFLSLFVCAFVIFNTFSVVVTQRFRELALARAVGATPAQVRRSLLTEGLLVGVVASGLGIAAGAGVAYGLQALLGALDLPLPSLGFQLATRTVVVGVCVGTIVTVLSVAIPAVRAGRTKPVDAMRSAAVDRSGVSTKRLVLGGLSIALAVGLLLGVRLGVLPKLALAGGTS
ncbi:MAG: ABC transporter permease, partial [Actinomycetes bacterium]